MSEFIEKRWDLPTMEKRMENLKKVIDPFEVDVKINLYLSTSTDDRLDALYLAYYDLKDKYCKLDRKKFGTPKKVDYKQKNIGMFASSFIDTSLTEPTIAWTNPTVNDITWYDNYYTTASEYYSASNWEPLDYTWTITTRTNAL
jgi:hypothetical protein